MMFISKFPKGTIIFLLPKLDPLFQRQVENKKKIRKERKSKTVKKIRNE